MILFESSLSLLFGWVIRLNLNSSVLRFLGEVLIKNRREKQNVDILSHAMIFSLSFLTVHIIKIEKSTDFTF